MKETILLSTFFIFSSLLFSQNITDSLTIKLEEFLNDKEFIGLGIGIVNEEGLVYSKSFGFLDEKNKIPYTVNTLQPIASISKTLIGVSLMKAQELGKLDLDDAINKYLPFPIINPYYPNEKITIRQLAMHTSTLKEPEYLYSYIFKEALPPLHLDLQDKKIKRQAKNDVKERNSNSTAESDRVSLVAFIKERFHPTGKFYKKKNFVKAIPGSEYYYSNEGAALAAYILEQATGTNFIEFTKKHILDPLEMKNSSWDHKSLQDKEDLNRAKLYYFGQEIPRFENITYPDGLFVTSISDFSKYMVAMINGYNAQNNILLSESYTEMMTKLKESDEEGIFWEVDTKYKGYVGFSGKDMGIMTIAHFFKKEKMGVIIFSNTSHTKGLDQEFINLLFILKRYCEKVSAVETEG